MAASSTFKTPLNMTFIITAAAIVTVDGVTLLTDPFFSEAGSSFDHGVVVIEIHENPALNHEDHFDNLDPLGRQLLDGRRVITTMDGVDKLKPHPEFKVTSVPCQYLLGGECTGLFIPNVIYFAGDTIYVDDLVHVRDNHHISVAIFNLGAATITMGGKDAAKLARESDAGMINIMDKVCWLEPGVSKRVI
ncbi:MAG: hypothetical protein EXX96DRAFT_593255 [Benjaminiella poitrasii]|nr:MAG: hypothetical protein EXX96DRAFT_593255 [Benjaminiella poitrasii]